MSHEKHIQVHEKHETTHLSAEQLKAHHEQLEKARHEKAEHAKRSSEHDHIRNAEQLAKAEATASSELTSNQAEKPAHERSYTREDKAHSFNTTMHHVRQQLTGPQKVFSKVIHQPVVEKTSEFVGKTVARPSGILGATIAACIGLLSIYSIARFAGFSLSGSEMPLLLIGGFIAGLLIEWIFKSLRSILMPQRG